MGRHRQTEVSPAIAPLREPSRQYVAALRAAAGGWLPAAALTIPSCSLEAQAADGAQGAQTLQHRRCRWLHVVIDEVDYSLLSGGTLHLERQQRELLLCQALQPRSTCFSTKAPATGSP